jgi:putative colanic acid biosynthesis UDP-glucose lipid carrier transferase
MAVDALIVFGSFVVSQLVYPIFSATELDRGASYTLVGIITALVYYVVARAQDGKLQQLGPNATGSVLRLLLTAFGVVIVLGYGLKQAEVHSRLWFALAFATAFAAISMKNSILHALIHNGLLREFVVERIALFGDTSIAQSLKSSLEREYQHLCRITIYEGGGGERSDTPGEGDRLGHLIEDGLDNKFDRIIICLPPAEIDRMKDVVDAISFLSARIEACVGHAELRAMQSQVLRAPGQILIDLDDRPQNAWSSLVKRLLDLTIGTILLVVSAPLILFAAIAIKLESRGPVFFRQRRHGWNHSIISVWKLRTMTVQEDGATIKQAVANDPRVTRVGRILRMTSIDELPQLFNVLSGEMSLVGPRPHALAHNVHYSRLIASYACRHRVKPGLTGWAQVRGLRGNSEDISQMVARAEADIWYVRNWSILLDLKIILITPFVILFQKNAI